MACGVRSRRVFLILAGTLLTIAVLLFLGVAALTVYTWRTLDFARDEMLFSAAQGDAGTRYYATDRESGEVIELERMTGDGSERTWTRLADISPLLREGFLAVEDRKFYGHRGFDLSRTIYAAINRVVGVRPQFGASTVSQQVIKNISGDTEKTWKRKFNEILRACHMEKLHTKEEILELYLNVVPMGENTVGVEAAAHRYFGKSAASVTPAEAATLIGITNAPGRYQPHLHPDACLKKRNEVLSVLLSQNVISREAYETARTSSLGVLPDTRGEGQISSWFCETVNDDIVRDLGAKYGMSREAARALLLYGGLRVMTTENPDVQEYLDDYFADASHFPAEIRDGLDYAMVITDSQSGNLLAIAGGVGRKQGNRLLNLATVPHTPGSALKPIALYAPVLEMRMATWSSVFDDVPVFFREDSSGSYSLYPHNYPDRYDGLISLKDALRLSKNTVAVRLCETIGKREIYRRLKENFGFSLLSESMDGKSDLALSPLALGQLTYGVSLRDLTGAYSVFPGDGIYRAPRSYLSVYDRDGKCLLDGEAAEHRVFREGTARIMTQMLAEVVNDGTARSVSLAQTVDTAGKTGTSGSDKDRLFIGFTPYYTAGIWCGYRAGGHPVGNHAKNQLTVWDEVMKELHERTAGEITRSFSTDGLVRAVYCRDDGGTPSDACAKDPRGERTESGWFEAGYEPEEPCTRHRLCRYDTVAGGVACPMCPYEDTDEISLLDVPDRDFPFEVPVTDAEYVIRDLPHGIPLGDREDMPFFGYAVRQGRYIGRSRGTRQYNATCPVHGGEWREEYREELSCQIDFSGVAWYNESKETGTPPGEEKRRHWNIA